MKTDLNIDFVRATHNHNKLYLEAIEIQKRKENFKKTDEVSRSIKREYQWNQQNTLLDDGLTKRTKPKSVDFQFKFVIIVYL